MVALQLFPRFTVRTLSKRLLRSLPDAMKAVVDSLGPGDLVIDVGAHVGAATQLFSSTGARVIAFEPHPQAFRQLCRSLSPNADVSLLQAAASIDSSSFAPLYLHSKHMSFPTLYAQASSLMDNKPNVDTHYVSVVAIELCEILSQLDDIKIMKVDIEGYETILVPELVKSGVLGKIRNLWVETHDKKWPDLQSATRSMKEAVELSAFAKNVRWDWP